MPSNPQQTYWLHYLWIYGFVILAFGVVWEMNRATTKTKKPSGEAGRDSTDAMVFAGASQKTKSPMLRNTNHTQEFEQFKTEVERQAYLYPQFFLLESPSFQKKVALTFDDGPDTTVTPEVMRILKAQKVKATFFVVGFKILRHKPLLQQMLDEGHCIGNHSFDHPNFKTQAWATVWQEQIEKTEKLTEKLTGKKMRFVRPPYGQLTDAQIKELGKKDYRVVNWSIDAYDWDNQKNGPDAVCDRIMNNIHPGAIILMHNGEKRGNTVLALPALIRRLRAEGYEPVALDELLATMAYHRSAQE